MVKKWKEVGSFMANNTLLGTKVLLMVQKSGKPPGMVLKPCKLYDIYHINWLAGFLNHQQYHPRPALWSKDDFPNFRFGGVWIRSLEIIPCKY